MLQFRRLRRIGVASGCVVLGALFCTSALADSADAVGVDALSVRAVPTALLSDEAKSPQHPAWLALVIDDLGYSQKRDREVLALPGALTVAVLPQAPHAQAIAKQAQKLGREVILHQPMETLTPTTGRERGLLRASMGSADYAAVLGSNLAAVPGSVGVNNHRGSALTADIGAMDELMLQLKARSLYFLDSRTTAATVAHDIARQWGVPTIQRDVFLDHHRNLQHIDREFRRALGIARRQGHAVIIAHPHRESIDYLREALDNLPDDVRTTRVSDLLSVLQQRL